MTVLSKSPAPEGHAFLSASGSSMWIACPPSARLQTQFKDTPSEYAAEGTHAHAACAELLEELKDNGYVVDDCFISLSRFYDAEMCEAIQAYTDFVTEIYVGMRTKDPGFYMGVEEKLHYDSVAPDGWGTCDCLLIGGDDLYIIDFKYGKGVPVSAVRNNQLRLYAIGALQSYALIYDIKRVHLCIIQPRLHNIGVWDTTPEDLSLWGKQIRPIADMAIKGLGDFVPGAHCRWCRAKMYCRAWAADIDAQYKKAQDGLMTDADMVAVHLKTTQYTSWLNTVSSYMLKEAVKKPDRWPGLKLVEGKGRREISDETRAKKLLLSEDGVSTTDIMTTPQLKGITALGKVVGTKRLTEILSDVLCRTPGKPTLVSADDPRPEYVNVTDSDFEDI